MLPKQVVAEDRRLDAAVEEASEALMHHRWHWTLDESNPERVTFSEYARSIGRGEKVVRTYANGYVILSSSGGRISPTEARERSAMTAETEAAAQAVAEARGISFPQASKTRPVEVRRVREIARERAEQRGTTVEEETRKVADWTVKAEKAEQARQADRREKIGLRFIELEGELEAVKRRLVNALNIAHSVPWGNEEQELLSNTLGNVKALLNLIDVALAGAADVDWDAELEKLTEVK